MKVDFTVSECEKAFRKYSPLRTYFKSVVQRMPAEVKEILERSKGRYVSGEIALWDLLTAKGVSPNLAAEISLAFPPDPIAFDPGIISSKDLREKFDTNIRNGKDPLEILVELAALNLYSSFIKQPMEELEKFKECVAKQKAKYSY